MLKLLLGGSGSGKTTLLYQRIRARAEAGEKSILLVPEQFTSSTEAAPEGALLSTNLWFCLLSLQKLKKV